jgi:hypothetical protein
MIYLEMSRDPAHGGGTWAFPNCVWAPTEKEGGGTWPFWTKVCKMRVGDIVLHLRGVTPHANFVGFSTVAGDGFITERRPPDPGDWAYANKFYRADLTDFTSFHTPINLDAIFKHRKDQLEAYFDMNKARDSKKLNLFFVRQAGRLQCLNGAYLSDVDSELFAALFDETVSLGISNPAAPTTVETGWQLALVKARIGQNTFADQVKNLYGSVCCFPGCEISDRRFLVGSHIARWCDNESLRGNLGNGLCLCLVHDKAFEIGLFTLDEQYRVFVNPKEDKNTSPVVENLRQHAGQQIRLSKIHPLDDALLEHWIRIDVMPKEQVIQVI